MFKKCKFKDHEIDIIKNLVLEKIHRQRMLKEYFALQLLE